ncbi:hypothetical protein MC885_008553 [Smutsia gigantea]|nr:hypothetical protein MC885_008553 [Smutsia gigantea]
MGLQSPESGGPGEGSPPACQHSSAAAGTGPGSRAGPGGSLPFLAHTASVVPAGPAEGSRGCRRTKPHSSGRPPPGRAPPQRGSPRTPACGPGRDSEAGGGPGPPAASSAGPPGGGRRTPPSFLGPGLWEDCVSPRGLRDPDERVTA